MYLARLLLALQHKWWSAFLGGGNALIGSEISPNHYLRIFFID